jgi:hypothetical protein
VKEPPPLRLSDWSDTPAGGPGTPQPPPALPSDPPASEAAPPRLDPTGAAAVNPAQDNLPAPLLGGGDQPFPHSPTIFRGFDLLRIPGGTLRRWRIPATFAMTGAILGVAAGALLLPVKSTVTVRLMARDPQTFASSTTSYLPSKPQGATLLGALASPQVAREVAAKLGDVRADQLLDMISVSEVRKTDFVDIVVVAPYDAERTAQLAQLWGEEALRFTRGLQADEIRETKAYLEEQLNGMNSDLAALNREITALREEAGVVDVPREIESALNTISELDLRQETVATDLEATERQVASLRQEIRKHGPGLEQLRTEEEKLAQMAEYYTEQNPIFQETKERLDKLRAKMDADMNSPEAPLSGFTGTEVGNALYLQIIEAEGKRDSLVLQRDQLSKLLEAARQKLKELPQMQLAAAPLLERAQSMSLARDALLKRLQEVTVFAEVSPGYYRLFKVPTARDVYAGSRMKRVATGGAAGAFVFFFLGLLVCAGREFMDPTVRTPAEAEAALGARGLARIPAPFEKSRETVLAQRQQLWAASIGALSAGRVRAFWTPVPTPGADIFWQALLEAGRGMGIGILVVDLSRELEAALSELPRVAMSELSSSVAPPDHAALLPMPALPAGAKAREMAETLKAAGRHHPEVWVVATGPLHESMARLLREFPEPVVLCALGQADRDFWKTQRALLGEHRPLKGVVSIG